MIDFIIPLRTHSKLNQRLNWAARYTQTKAERNAGYLMTPRGLPLPCVVTLTRIGPRALDSDNAVGALKGIRDGIADRLGVDDGSPLIEWRYAQAKGQYGVRVQIESLNEKAPVD